MKKILPGLILLWALAVRVAYLDKSPVSVSQDEASLGYTSYSILKTGRDEYGQFLPLNFRSFGDFKPALYSYLSIPFIYLWGLNQTTVRLVSVLAGVASLAAFYKIFELFNKNYWQNVMVLGIMALAPWNWHYSRIALETNLSAAIFAWGGYCFLVKKQGPGTILLALSAYGYHSARVAGPMFLVLWLGWRYIRKQKVEWKWLVVLIGLLLPLVLTGKSSDSLARFKSESVWRMAPFAPEEVFGKQLTVNSLYFFGVLTTGKIAGLLSPTNFTTSFYPWVKESVQYVAEFNALGGIFIIFLIIGIREVFLFIRQEKIQILILWLAAATVPVLATWNWFHLLRMLPGMMVLQIVIGLGVLKILNGRFRLAVGILAVWQMVYGLNSEFNYSQIQNSQNFNANGYKAGVPQVMAKIEEVDKVVVDTPDREGYIFFLFYGSIEPRLVQVEAGRRLAEGNYGSFNFDKFEFRTIDWERDQKMKKTILWMPNREVENSYRQYKLKDASGSFDKTVIVWTD